MKITKLEYQKEDPNRANIYVDDKFIAGVNVNDLLKLDLYKGKEVSKEDLTKIVSESDFGKLFNKALNFISFRPRSIWEVRFKFRDQDKELLEKVIDKLQVINQLNDQSFAAWFIDQRTTFKPKGKRALRFELIRKGIDKKIIDEALQEGEESEFELALRASQKKKFKNREQLQRFLASRGFGWDTINEVVAKTFKKGYNIDS